MSQLEWTVNAYTLTFAVLLMLGAALGDRFGRKRLFLIGMVIFTAGSAAAAVAPSIDALIAARAIQGVGGAIVTPLTLTLLSAAVPAERRGMALGAWGGSPPGVALGPVIGGAVVQGLSWQWIFWLNVPFGLIALPLGARFLRESYGPAKSLDLGGVALSDRRHVRDRVWAGAWEQRRAGQAPNRCLASCRPRPDGCFVAWELRAREPMLPMGFFRAGRSARGMPLR